MPSYDENVKIAEELARRIREKGGTAYFVGGYVRDKLLGIENKDIDIEVHSVKNEVIEEILDSMGERLSFGKSFGVYNLKGSFIDIALPRKEECTGERHTDFRIDTDPYLGTEKASRRRDFTINALMQNVLTAEIIDHHGGVFDLKAKVIRHIDDSTFPEDNLRVLRGAQFAARFEFDIAEETIALCRKMDVSRISSERVMEELKKALLKADKPSVFFRSLLKMNKLSPWFSEVEELCRIEQNKKYHPEGNVFEHTMMVLDNAAEMRNKTENPLGFMLAALVHDFGKIEATEVVNGEIHAYNHEKKGLPIIKNFLKRITNEKKLTSYILELAEFHMKPNVLALCKASVKSTNKMFDSVTAPMDLIYLAICDRGENGVDNYSEADSFLFERAQIYREYMSRPYVSGKDLIDAGLEAGEDFKALLELAHKLRLAGVEKSAAMKQIISYKKP